MKLKSLVSVVLSALVVLSAVPCALAEGEDVKVYSELKGEYSTYSVTPFAPSEEKICALMGASVDEMRVNKSKQDNGELRSALYSFKNKTFEYTSYCAWITYKDRSQDNYSALSDIFNECLVVKPNLYHDYLYFLKAVHSDEYNEYHSQVFADPEIPSPISADAGDYTAQEAYDDALEFINGLIPENYTPFLYRMVPFSVERMKELLSGADTSVDYNYFAGIGKIKNYDESVGGAYLMFFSFTIPQGYMYGGSLPGIGMNFGDGIKLGGETVGACVLAADGKVIYSEIKNAYVLEAQKTGAPVVDADTALMYYNAVLATDDEDAAYLKIVNMPVHTSSSSSYKNVVVKPLWMIVPIRSDKKEAEEQELVFPDFIEVLKPEFLKKDDNSYYY